MDEAIRTTQLSFAFGARLALDQVDLEVARGEVFGLLGPNGAGKTTLVRLLNGLYQAEPGKARVWGFDPATQGTELRRHTGVLTESPSLNETLTVAQNLEFYGTLYGVAPEELEGRIARTLESVGLTERRQDRAGTLSKGLKQRLAIARALLHDPPIVFLDEPTSGLDPESAAHVNDLILELKRGGRTIFLCTHRLAEAERICDRFGFLDRGRLRAVGTRLELEQRLGIRLQVVLEYLKAVPDLPAVPGATLREVAGMTVAYEVADRETMAALVAAAAAHGSPPWRVEPRRPSLEDLYFTLVRHEEVRA